MAGTAAIISAVTAVGSGVAQNQAAKAQNKAQRRAASIERAAAQIESNRRARRAIAARRIQEAEIIQSGATEGLRSSSAVSGAVGSLRTQTASNIGAAQTQLSAQLGQSNILERGATRAARFGSIANTVGGLSSASSTIASSPKAIAKIKSFF